MAQCGEAVEQAMQDERGDQGISSTWTTRSTFGLQRPRRGIVEAVARLLLLRPLSALGPASGGNDYGAVDEDIDELRLIVDYPIEVF